MSVPARQYLVVFIALSSSVFADTCDDWFKNAKIAHGVGCLERCAALPVGMDTFDCPNKCKEVCGEKPQKCKTGEHEVQAHRERGFYHGNDKYQKPQEIKAHCEKNSSDYKTWRERLKIGRPVFWMFPKEKTAEWTPEELERVLIAVQETPDLLKREDIDGIYRMHQATDPANPASRRGVDVVLYDEAFSEDQNLTHVLDHELAHRLYGSLSDDERSDFAKAGEWKEESGRMVPKRNEKGFVRMNGMLSPEEDFADDVTIHSQQPKKLKKTAPKVYQWMEKNIGPKMKRGAK